MGHHAIGNVNELKAAVPDGENVRSKLALDLGFSALVEAIRCMPQSALPGPCVHARPVSCKAQPLTGFLLVFPRGNADLAGSRLRIKEYRPGFPRRKQRPVRG